MFIKKIISSSLLLFVLLTFNACMPKQADGKYHTQYSYHPYFKMHKNTIATTNNYSPKVQPISYHAKNTPPNYLKSYQPQKIKAPQKRFKSVIKEIKHNDEENYPSNIPARGY